MITINFLGFFGIIYLNYYIFLKTIKVIFKKDNYNSSIFPFIISVCALFILSVVMGSYIQEVKYMFTSKSYIIITQVFTVLILTHLLCDVFKLRFIKTSVNVFLKVFATLFFMAGIQLSTFMIPFFESLFNLTFKIYQIPVLGFILSTTGLLLYFTRKLFKNPHIARNMRFTLNRK